MNVYEAKQIFDKDSETKGYIPDEENDLVFVIDGYCFVVQTFDGFNNVIVSKYKKSKSTLKDVFYKFREKLIENKIDVIRIEGRGNRYGILKKMFPNNSFMFEVTDNGRYVYYGKVNC